ncbi:MAG: response regulator [Desulfurivibrionaceae bacterium]
MNTLLLIEDDLMILDTTRELLKLLGYQVYTAKSGGSALDLLAGCNGEIDLVLLDLSLQDMDGRKLLVKMVEQYPGLKFVICSGSLPDELDFEQHPAVKGILHKPFELNDLRKIVEKVINGE